MTQNAFERISEANPGPLGYSRERIRLFPSTSVIKDTSKMYENADWNENLPQILRRKKVNLERDLRSFATNAAKYFERSVPFDKS